MKLIFSSAIALVFAGSTTAAFAKTESNTSSGLDEVIAVVSFADLDLASPTDAHTLLDRVHKTARKVCLRSNAGTSLEAMKDRRTCMTESYARGVAAINAKKSIDVEALAAQAPISREIVVAD
jgi:UrcA family protein